MTEKQAERIIALLEALLKRDEAIQGTIDTRLVSIYNRLGALLPGER